MADLHTFTLADTSVVRFTSADVTVVESGRTFLSSLLLSRGVTRLVKGVQVDTLSITMNAGLTDTINGLPWLQAIANGILDGANYQLERIFASAPGVTPAGAVILFTGQITETEVGSTSANLTVSSDLILLNTQMPRNLYQSGCLNSVYDTGCGVNKASFGQNLTINSGSTKTNINATASGNLALGEMVITSGPNTGAKRTIKSYSSGVFSLSYPLPFTPNTGDTFTAFPGCDKRYATCTNTFGNGLKWRAYPLIPVPETTM
jgi:uncharacterized phage protein (TIGR02218 family)